MQTVDPSNKIFQIAADLVMNTSSHVFITGKAGTGKTTFLKHIREQTVKKTVVIAPTGVAAINAGGVTAHSMFQLPFGPFVPGVLKPGAGGGTDRNQLFRNIRFSGAKRELYQELELLIIDEVSMLRADMLDAIDTVLRHFRRNRYTPFGGVQVVYIGDMFQLPPVVQEEEWKILSDYYPSPFFFDARVTKEMPPVYIELKKIYRQNEQHFIDILNRVRNNEALQTDLQELNKRYDPKFQAAGHDQYITLTTHNHKADKLNEAALKTLPGKLHSFPATIEGEFSDKSMPTDAVLKLKEGAQVMFIRNDGEGKRYYNGKLGIVTSIQGDEITVSLGKDEGELKLEKEVWKNIRYQYDKEKEKLQEEELGSFKQFPIRLAWAITIHKSQGLTFERAVIDAGAAFAPGQVYVALSRCTSLNGLVLHSVITPGSISTDPGILEFAKREENEEALSTLLLLEKDRFQQKQLLSWFDLSRVRILLTQWMELMEEKDPKLLADGLVVCRELLNKLDEQEAIAQKFRLQLQQILDKGERVLIEERVNKALAYFSSFYSEMVEKIGKHRKSLEYASRIGKYLEAVAAIQSAILLLFGKSQQIAYKDCAFTIPSIAIDIREAVGNKKKKAEKGSSMKLSLELFQAGKSVIEIAALRKLSISTIESHLASFVLSGELPVHELVSPDKLAAIQRILASEDEEMSSIKSKLGDGYTWTEIRATVNHLRWLKANAAQVIENQ